MGTWVTCPNCIKDLPRKYKNKKERKSLHQPTCNQCKNGSARKAYEVGVKRGIWLRKWKRAVKAFNKAAKEFENIEENEAQLTTELMEIMCELQSDKSKPTAQKAFQQIISGRYANFLGKKFQIPEFMEFDPLYYEAKAWDEFLKIENIKNIYDKIPQMKTTSREFYNIGYGQLYFSTYIVNRKMTNVEISLNLEAESEENLGIFYASRGDIENASIHLSNAISAYISLEQSKKAKQLRMTRQSFRMETSCWICGAKSKGHRQTFNFKYTGLAENHYDRVLTLLTQRQERNPSMYNDTIYTTSEPIITIQNKDVQDKEGKLGIYLATCTVCQGLLDELSQDVVDKALIPVWESIQTLQNEIQNLISTVNSLQNQINQIGAMSHRH